MHGKNNLRLPLGRCCLLNRAAMRAGKEVTPMVSYDELFQYTLVLLTVVLTTLALIKRKK